VANIKVYLRLQGEKISGNKIELAELIAVKDPDEINLPVITPLAIHVLMADNGDLGDGSQED
jgi:hypothetical protein